MAFTPPRVVIVALIFNSLISIGFFLWSYNFGTYNEKFLPIAAATILLWALADVFLTNQLVYDKERTAQALKQKQSLRHLLLIKNITILMLALPLTILFGTMLAIMLHKANEILYGTIMTYILIWGWLGISNALSVLMPFIPPSQQSDRRYTPKDRITIGALYSLPWVLLPAYAVLLALPFVLFGWLQPSAGSAHIMIAMLVLLSMSISIWLAGLSIAGRIATKSNSRISKLIA